MALSKTEIVVHTKKRIQKIIPMRVRGLKIESKPTEKYLGLKIDSETSLGEQIQRTADIATRGVTSFVKFMANIGGPSPRKRRLLMSSVNSAILYGVEV